MRSKYRLYVCREKGCAVIGKKDGLCPTHGSVFVALVVQPVPIEIPDALKTAKQRQDDLFNNLLKGFGKK